MSDMSPFFSPIPEVNFVRCHTISSSPEVVKVLKKQVSNKETEQNENSEKTVKLRKSKSKSTLTDIVNKPKSKVVKKKNSKIKLLSGQKKLTQFFTTSWNLKYPRITEVAVHGGTVCEDLVGEW